MLASRTLPLTPRRKSRLPRMSRAKTLPKRSLSNSMPKRPWLFCPPNRKIVLQDLRDVTGVDRVRFATEEEFQSLFPDCEIGAMPPFGNLYGLAVYVSPELAEEEEIAFNAGSHTELFRMAFKDFERLVKPKVMSFTT